MRRYINTVKVDKKIKPIPFPDRKLFDIEIGGSYYISFHSNEALPCTLVSFDDEGIAVDVPTKPRSKKGYIDGDGNISHDWKTRFGLFRDEIGRTPEEAVLNEVTL